MRLYENRPSGTIDRARQLRRDAPAPERRLLRALREAFPDLKWRHQAPIGPFYADILCFSARLIIEVDGDTHVGREREDAARTSLIEREGFRILRFSNLDVMEGLDGVVGTIATSLSHREKAEAAEPRKGEDSIARSEALLSPRAATRLAPLPQGEGM